jgi:hypothetical protein
MPENFSEGCSKTMQVVLIAVVVLHVLAGVFWAGTTFVLARNPESMTPALARAQTGAMTLAILAGIALWAVARPPEALPGTRVLEIGAACALLAAIAQIMRSQRAAMALLVIAVASMAAARFA